MKAIPFKHQNVVIAEKQPQYRPLPALKITVPCLEIGDPDGHVVFCMGLSLKERLRVLFLGRIWVSLMTFGALTPSFLSTYRKEVYTHSDFDRLRLFLDLGAIIYFEKYLSLSYLWKQIKGLLKNKWVNLYFHWGFEITYELCGYFDARHHFTIHLIYVRLVVALPIYSKYTDECDPPQWGISYHHQTLWIYKGGKGNMNGGNKWWTMYMPWKLDWVRTSNLRQDGAWENEKRGDRKDFYKDEWKKVIFNETHKYTYTLKSGEVQHRLATIKVEEREWRLYWFKWLPFPKKIRKSIAVNFNNEIGEETGSWKGGCTGCGYELLDNETPLESLRRMEKKQKF